MISRIDLIIAFLSFAVPYESKRHAAWAPSLVWTNCWICSLNNDTNSYAQINLSKTLPWSLSTMKSPTLEAMRYALDRDWWYPSSYNSSPFQSNSLKSFPFSPVSRQGSASTIILSHSSINIQYDDGTTLNRRNSGPYNSWRNSSFWLGVQISR